MSFRWLKRPSLRIGLIAILAGLQVAAGAIATPAGGLQPLPKRDKIRVAFLLGQDAFVIDFAGPWEAFLHAGMYTDTGQMDRFELYTVAATDDLVVTAGGMKIKPDYTTRNAPQPNVIVVPAQTSTPESRDWLKRASAGADVTMSVCTGAMVLAQAGVLQKGMRATTHHEAWDRLANEYPDIQVIRGARFVDNGKVATAGGLTSGIDTALHVVARYFGEETAARTAEFLEHSSKDWRSSGTE